MDSKVIPRTTIYKLAEYYGKVLPVSFLNWSRFSTCTDWEVRTILYSIVTAFMDFGLNSSTDVCEAKQKQLLLLLLLDGIHANLHLKIAIYSMMINSTAKFE